MTGIKQLIGREFADVAAKQGGNIYRDERQLQAPLPEGVLAK